KRRNCGANREYIRRKKEYRDNKPGDDKGIWSAGWRGSRRTDRATPMAHLL
ncbi:10421_t:CDS:1, partial [Gigaspora rosea]